MSNFITVPKPIEVEVSLRYGFRRFEIVNDDETVIVSYRQNNGDTAGNRRRLYIAVSLYISRVNGWGEKCQEQLIEIMEDGQFGPSSPLYNGVPCQCANWEDLRA